MRIPRRTCCTAFLLAVLHAEGATGQSPTGIVSGTVSLPEPDGQPVVVPGVTLSLTCAGMEPRICELREDFALRKIPTASFAANALYLEIIRLAYNLVTAFQRNCLEESWHNLTLQKLRYKLFLLPGELTRPQNRPILRLRESPILRDLAHKTLEKTHRLKPLYA